MRTTIYIKSKILNEVDKAAGLSGLSQSTMIKKLLKNVMQEGAKNVRIGRLVKYQDKDDSDSWRRFHITFREDEYECFQDLRKLLKKSLSLILAEAVKKYIGKLLTKRKNRDNYPHVNYIIIREMIGTIISWRLIWGYPPNIARLLHQSSHAG